MIHPGAADSATVRSCFVIDDPMSIGRDFAEIPRTVVALRRTMLFPA